jgi:elongation factor P
MAFALLRVGASSCASIRTSSSRMTSGILSPALSASRLGLTSAASSLQAAFPSSSPFLVSAPSRGAKTIASELRSGDVIEHGDSGGAGSMWRVESQHFSRMGMGRAFMQIQLRNVKLGTKKDIRLRTDEEVERVQLEQPKKYQVLFWDKEKVTVMEPTTFEQLELPVGLMGDVGVYLEEGMLVTVQTYQGEAAGVTVPQKVVCEVAEVTENPAGSARDNRDISAVLTNGVKIKVPKFIKPGDRIIVDTTTGKYVSKE